MSQRYSKKAKTKKVVLTLKKRKADVVARFPISSSSSPLAAPRFEPNAIAVVIYWVKLTRTPIAP